MQCICLGHTVVETTIMARIVLGRYLLGDTFSLTVTQPHRHKGCVLVLVITESLSWRNIKVKRMYV